MSADAEIPASRTGRIRLYGALSIAALAALIALVPRWTAPLREPWFDLSQRLLPREPQAMPATIVEIDARSLATFGRWPWPRSLLADLVNRVGAHGPAAIGLDILMPEADPASPANDALLARALAATPSVLAVAGLPERTTSTLRAPAFTVAGGTAEGTAIVRFAGAVASLDELNRAASGWGLISADPSAGVLRRVPLVAQITGTLIGAMAIEMFRVAAGAPTLRLFVDRGEVRGIAIGNAFVATEPDGGARVYFSPRRAERFVAAADVLHGRADADQLRGKLVLIAVTGLGLADYHYTPGGERMPGSEIHAQLLENLYEGTLLRRPASAPWTEAAAFALAGALLAWIVPLWKPRNAALVAVACAALLTIAALLAFGARRLLFDAATVSVALAILFGVLLVSTLTEVTRHRRALELVAHRERVRAARLAGELDAARRVQLATLPRPEPLCDARLDLAAFMAPAREVGGDLYDFFRLDHERLFLVVGDVAGKGLTASIFMAVSKALCKSAALRTATPEPGRLLVEANAEISRDNPQMLFVSAFAATLDLASGELRYCNAGHENPCLVHPVHAGVRRIADGDGPPLCAVDDYPYRGASLMLAPGEVVCIVSDGVTEAQNPAGALYGNERLEAVLRDNRGSAGEIVAAVRADVAAFVAGAEPADDQTIVVLRWLG